MTAMSLVCLRSVLLLREIFMKSQQKKTQRRQIRTYDSE